MEKDKEGEPDLGDMNDSVNKVETHEIRKKSLSVRPKIYGTVKNTIASKDRNSSGSNYTGHHNLRSLLSYSQKIQKTSDAENERISRKTTASLVERTTEKLNQDIHLTNNKLNKTYLEKLDRESPEVVAKQFQRRHDEFVKVMKNSSRDGGIINVLFSVLAKVTTATGDHIIYLSSALRQSLFIENVALLHLLSLVGCARDNIGIVKHAICLFNYIAENSCTSITSFYGVLTVLSDLVQEIRISDLRTPIIVTEFDNFERICSKIKTDRRKQKKKQRDAEDDMLPPDCFRSVNILPATEELLTSAYPFLRKNKEFGSYKDLEHYLDVQFRLLREDFISPLRENILQCRVNVKSSKDKAQSDVLVYNNVKVVGTTILYQGVCHVLKFDKSQTENLDWEFSKRLIHGSLLCLSYDKFETIFLAVVANREPQYLKEGIVEVQFTCGLETARTLVDEQFDMVESATYFEAYKHNLMALQQITELPFTEYIVHCVEDIKPPSYLRKTENTLYDLQCMRKDKITNQIVKEKTRRPERRGINVSMDKGTTLENISILEDESWPCKSFLNLDEAQYRAFQNALTHEFSITQGPPGTGKTYIGLKMAKALLANQNAWSVGEAKQPLLVVCYTNHALDQFLCGINGFFEGEIVRVGGRCDSEEMQQRGIKTMFKYISSDVRETSIDLRKTSAEIKERINKIKSDIERSDSELIKTDQLKKYMGRFLKSLKQGFRRNLEMVRRLKNVSDDFTDVELDMVEEWLGQGWLKINSQRRVVVHFENDEKIKSNNCVAYRDIKIMNERSQRHLNDVWQMSFMKRWELYKSWAELQKQQLAIRLEEYEEMYEENCQAIKRCTQEKHIQALKQADVIGMTTTGAAKNYEVLQHVKPKIVIVEEAAEVLEGHIVTSLSSECEHLILIGDHKQLRPSPAVYQLAKRYKLDISLFERMINNSVHFECLELQHRMRPEISQIIRLFYPNLKDHDSVLNKPVIRGISSSVYFVTHTYPETEGTGNTSHLNVHEAHFMVGLCRYLLKQEYKPSQITVLTTYSAQLRYLRKLMPKGGEFNGVNINIVDNYQGEENEIVLLSLVRSNASNRVGFMKTDNRVNVALSRAKNGLYVIGNFDMFSKASKTWTEIVKLLQTESLIGPAIPLFCRNHTDRKLSAHRAEDFDNVPEGGCTLDCDARLDCGHVCERKCHVYDTDHKEYRCNKPCIKVCENRHPCRKNCFENCGECEIPVSKIVPVCGHEQTMPCHQPPENWKCNMPCERKCKNKHRCDKKCFEGCGKCTIEIMKTIPTCGHEQLMQCFEDERRWNCRKQCEKTCKNNHTCSKMCFEICGKCMVEVKKEMPGCGHEQTMACYLEPVLWKCQALCEDILECGHKCRSKCSDIIHRCRKRVTVEIEKCGHSVDIKCYKRNQTILCERPCERLLDCGHQCTNKCYEQHTTKCHEKITIELEKCGHTASVECYRRKQTVLYKQPCENILERGHKCVRRCYEPHTTFGRDFVRKEMTGGHLFQVEYPQNTDSIICTMPCEFKLECGHQCRARCCDPHTKQCREEVEKILPCCQRKLKVLCMEEIERIKCPFPCEHKLPCGHPCESKCGEPHTNFCKVVVKKTLKCEHVKELYCGVNLDSIRCSRLCGTKLPCGHDCKNTCSQPHTEECVEKVNYKCRYGHIALVQCYKIRNRSLVECPFKCHVKLACGHICSGSCFECSGGTLHKVCSSCPLPGEKYHISAKRASEGIPCVSKCQNRCEHKRCEKLCFEPCADDETTSWPCTEQCNAECEHYFCRTKLNEDSISICTKTYDMVMEVVKNCERLEKAKNKHQLLKHLQLKMEHGLKIYHKFCGAPVDVRFLVKALRNNDGGKIYANKTEMVDEKIYIKIAKDIHEYQERAKLKSVFYAHHQTLQKRLKDLHAKLNEMDTGGDLYKIYKDRLEERYDNFENWIHFQKQGYKDLKKEIGRLEIMARTILSMQESDEKKQ